MNAQEEAPNNGHNRYQVLLIGISADTNEPSIFFRKKHSTKGIQGSGRLSTAKASSLRENRRWKRSAHIFAHPLRAIRLWISLWSPLQGWRGTLARSDRYNDAVASFGFLWYNFKTMTVRHKRENALTPREILFSAEKLGCVRNVSVCMELDGCACANNGKGRRCSETDFFSEDGNADIVGENWIGNKTDLLCIQLVLLVNTNHPSTMEEKIEKRAGYDSMVLTISVMVDQVSDGKRRKFNDDSPWILCVAQFK